MTKPLQSVRLIASITVPPLVATMLAGSLSMITDGERRCFEGLDLGTPGAMCTKMPFDPFLFVGFLLVHVLVVFPLGLWARRRHGRRQLLIGMMCAVGLVLGINDGRRYLGTDGTSDAIFAAIEVAIPVAIWSLLTLWLLPGSDGGDSQFRAA